MKKSKKSQILRKKAIDRLYESLSRAAQLQRKQQSSVYKKGARGLIGTGHSGGFPLNPNTDKEKYNKGDFLNLFGGWGDPIEFYGCGDPSLFPGDGSSGQDAGAIGDNGDILGSTIDDFILQGGVTEGFCGTPSYDDILNICTEENIINFNCIGGTLDGNNLVTGEQYEVIEGSFISAGSDIYPSYYELGGICSSPATLADYSAWLNIIVSIGDEGFAGPTTNTNDGFDPGYFGSVPSFTQGLIDSLGNFTYYDGPNAEADAEYNCCEDTVADLNADGMCYQHGCPYLSAATCTCDDCTWDATDETCTVDLGGGDTAVYVPGDGYTGGTATSNNEYEEWPIIGFGVAAGTTEAQELINTYDVCPPVNEVILGCMVEGADNYAGPGNALGIDPPANQENGSCTFSFNYVITLDACNETSATNYFCNNDEALLDAWADNMPQYDFGDGPVDIFEVFDWEEWGCDGDGTLPDNVILNFDSCIFNGCTTEGSVSEGWIVYEGTLTDPDTLPDDPFADFDPDVQIAAGGPCLEAGCPNHVSNVGQDHPLMANIPNIANDDDNDTVVNYNYVGNEDDYNINMADLSLPALGTVDTDGTLLPGEFGSGCPDANGIPNPEDSSCCYYSGCITEGADNYIGDLGADNGVYVVDTAVTCEYVGCMEEFLENYDPDANVPCGLPNDVNGCCGDDVSGCTDDGSDPNGDSPYPGQEACNYDEDAIVDDGSCEYDSCAGCTDSTAINYNATATIDDGTCEYEDPPEKCWDITIQQCGHSSLQSGQEVSQRCGFKMPGGPAPEGEEITLECVQVGNDTPSAEFTYYPGWTVSFYGCPDMGDINSQPITGLACVDNIPGAAFGYSLPNYNQPFGGDPVVGCCITVSMPPDYANDPNFYHNQGAPGGPNGARPALQVGDIVGNFTTAEKNIILNSQAGLSNAHAWCNTTSPCFNNGHPSNPTEYCNGLPMYPNPVDGPPGGDIIEGINESKLKVKLKEKYKRNRTLRNETKLQLLNEIPDGWELADVFDDLGDTCECEEAEWNPLPNAIFEIVDIGQSYDEQPSNILYLDEATSEECSEQSATMFNNLFLDENGQPVTQWSIAQVDKDKATQNLTAINENKKYKDVDRLIKKSQQIRNLGKK